MFKSTNKVGNAFPFQFLPGDTLSISLKLSHPDVSNGLFIAAKTTVAKDVSYKITINMK
jgi:hypothetical protein